MTMHGFGMERRRYPRVDASGYNIKLKVHKKDDPENVVFELIDFSQSGVRMVSKDCFQAGDHVEIEVSYKGKTITTEGKVVRNELDTDGNCFHGVALSSSDIFDFITKE